MQNQLLEHIINGINAFAYAINYDTYQICYVNQALKTALPAFETNIYCYQYLFDRTSPCENCPINSIQKSGKHTSQKMWFDKLQLWIQLEYTDTKMSDGHYLCVCTGIDITEIENSNQMTIDVLDGIHASAYVISKDDHRLLFANRELKRLLPELKIGDLCYRALWDNDQQCVHCPIPSLSELATHNSMKVFNQKINRWMSIDSTLIQNYLGKSAIVFTGYDITKSTEHESTLKNIAYNDLQLNIRNRIAFIDEIAHCYLAKISGYVIFISIKNFNSYNTMFGRKNGDALLQEIVARYKELFPNRSIYRVSGAKFAIISEEKSQAQKIAECLWKNFATDIAAHLVTFKISIDYVLLEFPRFASTPETMMHHIEFMFNMMKKQNFSQIMEFEETILHNLQHKIQIETAIKKALTNDLFKIHYQPIYLIPKKRFTKCEALLRLYDDVLGPISPAEFIPLAEEAGLINEIGILVIDKVLQKIADRNNRGLPQIDFNINVSAIQFSQPDFFEKILHLFNQYEVDPRQIVFEITESVMINSFDLIMEMMERFIHLGIRFALDDFGSGYANFHYISRLPFACIKIDKMLTDQITGDKSSRLIVKNIINIAKDLNFTVVAEGVETKEELLVLEGFGCDFIQGYLFSKPLPDDLFDVFLAK